MTLGYRLRVDKGIEESRLRDSALQLQQKMRASILQAQAEADRKEVEEKLALVEKRLELAKQERMVFESSPEGASERLRQEIVKKWNGTLPQIVMLGGNSEAFMDDFLDGPLVVSAADKAPQKPRNTSKRSSEPSRAQ